MENLVDNWYQKLIGDLKQLAFEGIVRTKHNIGKRILEDEEKFGKPQYGSRKIEELADDLDISARDLYYCIQFARKHPEIETAFQNSSWRQVIKSLQEPRSKELEFHEYCKLFPYDDDLVEILAQSIKENGLINPIIIYEGKILDGKIRYLACLKAGVDPKFEDYSGNDPLGDVISWNLHRQHFTESQRAALAVELEEKFPRINSSSKRNQ